MVNILPLHSICYRKLSVGGGVVKDKQKLETKKQPFHLLNLLSKWSKEKKYNSYISPYEANYPEEYVTEVRFL